MHPLTSKYVSVKCQPICSTPTLPKWVMVNNVDIIVILNCQLDNSRYALLASYTVRCISSARGWILSNSQSLLLQLLPPPSQLNSTLYILRLHWVAQSTRACVLYYPDHFPSRTSDPVEPIQCASVITSRPFSLPGTLVGTGWLQPRTHSRHGSAKPSPDLPEGHQKDFRTAVEAVEAVKRRDLI